MKKRPDVDALAASLTSAAAQPLQAAPAPPPVAVKKTKTEVKQVLLRMPPELYQVYDDIAVARTKATGRGVSIQQVILEKLAGGA